MISVVFSVGLLHLLFLGVLLVYYLYFDGKVKLPMQKYNVQFIVSIFSLYARQVEFEEAKDKPYLTVSPDGVVIRKDNLTEFYTLVQWQREYLLYKHIRDIKTFYQFRMWKAFNVWRKNVVRK